MIDKPHDDAAHRPPARPRRPWYRRGLWWTLPLLVMVIALIGVITHRFVRSADFERRVDELRNAGEPVSVVELLTSYGPTPPGSRIALLIQANVDAPRSLAAAEAYLEAWSRKGAFGPQLTAHEVNVLRAYRLIPEISAALTLLEEVDDAPLGNWSASGSVLDDILSGEIGAAGAARHHFLQSAGLAMHEGEYERAAAALRKLDALADAAAAHPSVVGFLVACSIGAAQAEYALVQSAHWQLGSAPGELERETIQRWILHLLDDTRWEERFANARRYDRAASIDLLRTMQGTGRMRIAWYAVFVSGATDILDRHAELIAQHKQPHWPAYQPVLAAFDRSRAASQQSWSRRFALLAETDPRRWTQVHYRLTTTRRMAAIALAIRLYRLDHDDAYPPSLDALVPAYLPAVPMDAMSAGQPIRYDPARRVLWSVGADMIDHNADAGGELMSRGSWQSPDFVVPLYLIPLNNPLDAPNE